MIRTKLTLEDMAAEAHGLALRAHNGQVDKAGVEYFEHPHHVARIASAEAYAVGVLHDVVEDTPITLEALREYGFPERVIEAVDAITRRPGEVYADYIDRVRQNPLAWYVKLIDVEHNASPARQAMLPIEMQKSLGDRYRKTLDKLAPS